MARSGKLAADSACETAGTILLGATLQSFTGSKPMLHNCKTLVSLRCIAAVQTGANAVIYIGLSGHAANCKFTTSQHSAEAAILAKAYCQCSAPGRGARPSTLSHPRRLPGHH